MTIEIKRFMGSTALIMALATLASPALAADWGRGAESYRDVSVPAAVPVPAPMPIPDYHPQWYFRFDAGLGVINDPDISDDLFTYGELDGPGPITGPGDARFADSSWFNGDFNTFLTLGGGVGYYLGRGWRIDATIEKRSNDDGTVFGQDEYETYAYVDDDGIPATASVYTSDLDNNGTPGDQHTRFTAQEKFRVDGTVWMANAYYDFTSGSSFTPYVGAGVGFAWNEIERSRTHTVDTCDPNAAAPSACEANGGPGAYTQTSTETETSKADKVTLAAAAMAGMSYDISDLTSVDIGYRYLYLQGADALLNIGGDPSRLEIGDQHIHQIRAGLRFNVH